MIEMLPSEFYPQLYRELLAILPDIQEMERIEQKRQEKARTERRKRLEKEYNRAIKQKQSEKNDTDKRREQLKNAQKAFRERKKSIKKNNDLQKWD
jgi:hypothetical protein